MATDSEVGYLDGIIEAEQTWLDGSVGFIDGEIGALSPVLFWDVVDGERVPLRLRAELTPAQRRALLTWGEFFPDAETTGCYDESVLEEVTGNLTIVFPGSVYRNKHFRGRVDVRAAGVRFENCKFSGPIGAPASDGILIATNAAQRGMVVEDCTIAPELVSHTTNCVMGHDFTLRRCNVYHGVDCVSVIAQMSDDRSDVVIEGTWLHDPVMFNTPTQSDNLTHNDLIQWHGMIGLRILGSRLEGLCAPGLGVVGQPPVGTWPNSLTSGNPFYPNRWSTSLLMGAPARKLMGELELRKSWLDGAAVGLNLSGPALEMFPDVGIVDGNWFGSDWRLGADYGVLAKASQALTLTNNHRWNKADPFDTSVPFNVRKNG